MAELLNMAVATGDQLLSGQRKNMKARDRKIINFHVLSAY